MSDPAIQPDDFTPSNRSLLTPGPFSRAILLRGWTCFDFASRWLGRFVLVGLLAEGAHQLALRSRHETHPSAATWVFVGATAALGAGLLIYAGLVTWRALTWGSCNVRQKTAGFLVAWFVGVAGVSILWSALARVMQIPG